MKTKFNYNAKQKKQLLKLAQQGLKGKIDLLPDLSSMYQEKLDTKRKLQKYKNILNDEIDILQTIKFDGYLLMILDIVNFAKQSNIFISCYGSIQNSLISYLLDIVDSYTSKIKKDFINFIPFEKKPTLNIVADFSRYYEIISFIKYKYPKQIKKVKNKTIKFNDNLQIKFIDLNINTQTTLKKDDVKNLGLIVNDPNINISQKQAAFTKVQNKKLKNAWLKKRKIELSLGLEALNIGDVLINKILMARDRDGYKPFQSIDEFKKRVPIINEIDKKTKKIVFDNLQVYLDEMAKFREDLRKYKEENGI